MFQVKASKPIKETTKTISGKDLGKMGKKRKEESKSESEE
jgi:hypothetical protein